MLNAINSPIVRYILALDAQYIDGNILQGEGEMDTVDAITEWMASYYINMDAVVPRSAAQHIVRGWLEVTLGAL